MAPPYTPSTGTVVTPSFASEGGTGNISNQAYDVQPYNVIGRSSFSGADILVCGFLAGADPALKSPPIKLEPQTITISCFREKVPVRALGHTNALGFTRGPRTYAGSIINTVIERHPLYQFLEIGRETNPAADAQFNFSYDEQRRRLVKDYRYTPDALPPLNLILMLQNEMGNRSSIVIMGVEFVNDGMTMSIEDVLTENTYQYVARDAMILTSSHNTEGARLPLTTEGYMSIQISTTEEFTDDPWQLNQLAEEYSLSGQNQTTQSLTVPSAADSNNLSDWSGLSFHKFPDSD